MLGVGVRALTSEFSQDQQGETYRNLFTLSNHINPENNKKVRRGIPEEFFYHDPLTGERIGSEPEKGDIVSFCAGYTWDVYQCTGRDQDFIYLARVGEQQVIKGRYF